MESKSIFLHFYLVWLISYTQAANILIYHQIASYSHQVATYPLGEALSKRGHQVTFITPWHHKGPYQLDPNITLIVPESLRQTIQAFAEFDFDINYRVEKKFPRLVDQFYPMAILTCDQVLNSPELKEWTSKTKELDLVILDNSFSECCLGIAHRYGAKHIVFNTVNHLANEYDQFGFLPESSAIVEVEIDPPKIPMTFFERVFNTLISLHFRWAHYSYMHQIDGIVRKYVKDSQMPFIDDLARNVSLVLYSPDLISDSTRSHPPLIVNVGGMSCHFKQEASKIPEKLKRFIEDPSSDGFIYISFGSVALSSKLPERVKQVFFDTVKAFPKIKFLWKWDGAVPENLPSNVYLAPWFPQNVLLGHEKIKGFITQSGRPSTMEALCNAVPMLSFPVLGDQDINSNRMESLGGSIKMELATVTREELKGAIQKLVYETRMKERMIQLRDTLMDQPMPPLEKAVWWTEYVLRHKDTSHLRAASFDQWWYERRLLDVWAFLYLVVISTLATVLLIMVYCARLFLCRHKMSNKSTKISKHKRE